MLQTKVVDRAQQTVFSNHSRVIEDRGFEISIRDFLRAITLVRISERNWEILLLRSGIGHSNTLQEIADNFGITRERVRQICKKASSALPKAVSLKRELNKIEESMSQDADPFEPHSQEIFLKEVTFLFDDPESVELCTAILRALALIRSASPSIEVSFPKLSYFISALHPPVKKHKRVYEAILQLEKERKERARAWTYKELILHILRDNEHPMHWRDIYSAALAMNKRSHVHPGTMANILFSDSEFVKVKSGTYALKEQGFEESDSYIETIWKVFSKSGKPLSFGELINGIPNNCPVPNASVSMYLEMNPRFYRSVNDFYGLRAWLREPLTQTLRTPRELIEHKKSLKRVAIAKRKGYRVDEIVERDRKSLRKSRDTVKRK